MLTLHKDETFAERYLLKEIIGARGTSEVWMAEDLLEQGELVALKIYASLDKSDQYFLERMQKELLNEQPLKHPHLLEIYFFDVYQGAPYVVTPFMAQGSLRSKFLDDGPFSEFDVAVILKQIGSVLQELHATEPPHLHQNIKPENILIAAQDDYVLADFRIHNQLKSVLPRVPGAVEGSYTAYAPPEQFTVRPGNYEASDIFSLGVTLYELCAGQLPWMGNGGLSLLQGVAVPFLPASYPRVLNNIIAACMDPKWENRPTAGELVEEGNYFIDNGRWKPYGRFSVAKVDVVKYEKRSPLKVALWVAATLAVLSVLGFLLYTRTSIIQNALNSVASSSDTTQTETLAVSDTSQNEGSDIETIASTETSLTEQKNNIPASRETTKQPVIQKPAAAKEVKPARETSATETESKPAITPTVKRPTYPKPASAEQYLAQLQNKSVPQTIKERLRKDVWLYFDRNTTVNYLEGGELVGILSADELVEIILDQENPTAIRIDSTRKNASGKVNQVFAHAPEAQ